MPFIKIIYPFPITIAVLSLGVALTAARADTDDKLPDGAVKRLGSLRWRHGEPITFLAMPSDGKTLVTAGQDSVLRLWDRETGQEIRRFVPPADGKKALTVTNFYMQGLTRAAMSKDGKLLAVALANNMVQLWDVETGQALRQFKGPLNGVGAMAFTPDGKTFAIRGISDRTCFLIETATGKEIRKLKPVPPDGKGGNIFGGAGDGTGLAISPDGKIIALPEIEFNNQRVSGSVTLFEIATGKQIRRFDTQMHGISAIAFSPDGKVLVYNTHNGIYLQEADSGKQIRQFNGANAMGANLMLFAPDGKTLAVKGRDQIVRLYDPNTGNVVRTLGAVPGLNPNAGLFANPNGALTTDMAFSADSKTLVIGGQQVPRFFEVATGKEQPVPGGGHRGAVTALMLAADGKTIASRGAEGVVRVWETKHGFQDREIKETAGTSAVRFSPDGKLVALGNNDGMVRLVEVTGVQSKRQFKAHQGTIASLAFSADGRKLATRGTYDGLLKIFDTDKGTELKQIVYQDIKAGNGGMVIMRNIVGHVDGNPLAISPDGRMLAAFIVPHQVQAPGVPFNQAGANTLRLFDVATAKEMRQIQLPAGRTIHQLVFSHDGRLLIGENVDKTVSVWEVASGQERSHFGTPTAAPTQTTNFGFVVINGVAQGGLPTPPVGTTIALSRDGSLIAAPGADHSIKVYDASLGKEVATFRGHDGGIGSLVFAADGKTLVSGGNDTTILVWDLTRLKREKPAIIAGFDPKLHDATWADLISNDAGKAGKTVQTLVAGSNASVALLKDRIKPAAPADAKQVEQWLRDLDSNIFKTRAVSLKELERLGELAVPALQKWLQTQTSLETRRRVEPLLEKLTGHQLTAEQIRMVRVIEVLDKVGTPEARQALEWLAGGAAGSLTTREAQLALDRANVSKGQ